MDQTTYLLVILVSLYLNYVYCVTVVDSDVLAHEHSDHDLYKTITKSGSCTMYGKCGEKEIDLLPVALGIPCFDQRKPQIVNVSSLGENVLKKFTSICPQYKLDTPLCCDHNQINDLAESTKALVSMLFKCPVCLHNIASYLCGFTCDPNQASFLNITSTKPAPEEYGHDKFQVENATVYVDHMFRDGIFNACVDVQGDQKPIDVLCGESCNSSKLLEYLGSKDNSPFLLNQKYNDPSSNETVTTTANPNEEEDDDDEDVKEFTYFNGTYFHCQRKLSPEEWPMNPSFCTCNDCKAACEDPHFPIPRDTDSQLRKLDISLVVIFIATVLAVVGYGVYTNYKPIAPSDQEANSSDLIAGTENGNSDGQTSNDNQSHNDQFTLFQSILFKWTSIITSYPKSVILFTIILIVLMSLGLMKLDMQEDPVELWSSPGARSRKEKEFFDENFGPFYRIEQVIVTMETYQPFQRNNVTFSGIFEINFLKKMFELQELLTNVVGSKTGVKLNELCFAPMDGKCMVQSPLNYIQFNKTILEKFNETLIIDHIAKCLDNPYSINDALPGSGLPCLSEWGGPGFREVVLGGYDDKSNLTWKKYANSTSFVITMLLKDSLNQTYREIAEDFEKSWLDAAHKFAKENYALNLSDGSTAAYRTTYFTGRSVTDELSRQSKSDVVTISISYICMFLYISLTLGTFSNFKRIFIDSKVTLGLSGVLIVLACVVTSIGVLAPFIQFNLIIIEVIPFLILAVGVDNMFLMVLSMRRKWIDQQIKSEENVANVLGTVIATEVGPSILISAFSESGCFFIGFFISSMPAVRVFALTAALSLVILLFLQMTLFLALLYLDSIRYARNSPDPLVWPFNWLIFSSPNNSDQTDESETFTDQEPVESSCYMFITDRILGDFCSRKYFRSLVVILWITTLFLCIRQIPRTEIGLEQDDSVPQDSYVLKYMKDQKQILRVGAPLYFVVNSTSLKFNYSELAYQNYIYGSGRDLGTIIQMWSQEGPAPDNPNTQYIRSHASSWLDQMLGTWYRDDNCCRVIKEDDDPSIEFCNLNDTRTNCERCNGKIQPNELIGDTFKTLMKGFLSQKPGPPPLCPFGGSAQYPASLNLTENYDVRASYYQTYHLPAKSSKDMINSIVAARRVSDEIQNSLKKVDPTVRVFPYSIFYVFYEQYLSSAKDSAIGIVASISAVFLVIIASRVLENVMNHIIFISILVSFAIHVFGFISYFGVSLNALTIVNLIMSVGISVEFTTHLMIAFVASGPFISDRVKRVRHAMKYTGSSVLAGITLTKFIGIIVLAFATSQIFTIYYFRFYLVLVIIGAYHGLVVLPAILSIIGQ